MQELQASFMHLSLGYSEKTPGGPVRHAIDYLQYKEASEVDWLELQEQAASQEQALFYI